MANNLQEELDEFLSEVENCLVSIEQSLNRSTCDLDGILQQTEWLLRDVLFVEELLPRPAGEELSGAVTAVYINVQNLLDEQTRRQRGRPCIDIPEEQLALLLEHRFSNTDIARLLNVSARTIRRRILQYGLENLSAHSCLPDFQLDEMTRSFVHLHPHSGRRSYQGFLRSTGFHIQQRRIRESMMRVDNRGVESRFRRALHRRQYSVCMPNSLWHIDGYHKLIRWRIVVHGGIDGYSRLPVYLHASTDNKADTVLNCFQSAVQLHGLPSRVRCDKGGENVKVSQFMLSHPLRGPGRNSCITGRSVHNQRIERFWRELYPACIAIYYTLFWSLEDSELLNRDDQIDLFCLHYVFLPRINHSLHNFREAYSHHPLRTAYSRSPYQLWISGIVINSGRDCAAMQGVTDIIELVSSFNHAMFPFITFISLLLF